MCWSSHGRNLRSCRDINSIVLIKCDLFQIYALLLTAVANTLSQSDMVDGAVWTKALKSGMETVVR